jgi:DNA-binding transcriptional LysR family regulator
MAQLDIDWLRVFDEIYKTSSVSKAADRLGMSQGAASTALNKLRDYYQDNLFSRTAHGMLPTPRAQALHPTLRSVLSELERVRKTPARFDQSTAARTFRICMTDISEIVLLPTLMNLLRDVAPNIRIEVEKISADSPRRLEDGEFDLAVGFMPQLDAGFYQQVLFEQSFVCLAARSHPRIGRRLSLAAFEQESHAYVATSGTGHAIVDKLIAKANIRRRIALSVPSFLGIARIVGETELLATVPRRFGEVMMQQERIQVLALPFKLPSYAVKQHWHERFHGDPGNEWLRQTIASLPGPVVPKQQVK